MEQLIHGGWGLARPAGQPLAMIKGGLPGDLVRPGPWQRHKSYRQAGIEKLLRPSPLRQRPRGCPETRCGGCQWLEVPEAEQAQLKRELLLENLKRQCALPLPEDIPVHPAPAGRHYRARVLLRAHKPSVDSGFELGFFAERSRDLVPIRSCLIAHPAINAVIKAARECPSSLPPMRLRIELQHYSLAAGVTVLLHIPGASRELEAAAAAFFASLPQVLWAACRSEGAPLLPLDVQDGQCFYTAAGSFSQVNPASNQLLRRRLVDLLDLKPGLRVLDLYCGNGNLSLLLARAGCEVFGIELSSSSIAAAQKAAAELPSGSRCRYVAADAATELKQLCREQAGKWDVLLLDPPRAGAKALAPLLQALRVPRIIYVSCEPSTLARDLSSMAEHYRIKAIEVFDMFPQTHHLESLVLLERSAT